MGILDRLKPQPRWKHSDPVVRLQAISELDDAIELAALAEHDLDAKVRTAALAKVGDPVVLGRVTTADADRDVRDAAADRLLALALDVANPEAATAAGLLSDVRRVSLIAKSAAADDVRGIALAKLTDDRALGGVARHAKVESTALAAAARLGAADELLATALNSEHRDVALAAFDRVVAGGPTPGADVALLEAIEARTQQKAVARRAKTMLQAIEDAETARRVAEEERRTQEASLCVAVERLTDVNDPDRIAADLERLSAAWDTLATTDAAAGRRFAAGADAARLRLTQRRSEIAAALEETRRRGEALASREALCRRAETIEGEYTLGQLDTLEEEWARLVPLVGYERDAEQLAALFAATVQACRTRLALGTALQEARSALDALVIEAESLSTEEATAADRWGALSRDARRLVATLNDASQPASDLQERLAVVARAFEARETTARQAAAQAARDRVTKLTRLVARAKRAAESGTVTLREGDRLLRDIATGVEHVGSGEKTKEIGAALASLRTLQDQIASRVKELRDLDEWRRFANAQQQEELIAMAEAIVASLKAEEEAGAASDLAATAKALRELQARWQMVADGPLHSARRLWGRFKTAIDFIRSRCEIYFAQVRQERSTSRAAKAEIVAAAEALADSADWSKTASRFQELQKAWEDIGPMPDDAARNLARRFRAACNAFFTRRRDALSSQSEEWKENLARKEGLCERAEQLAESTEWDTAASEVKKLQVEWKAIGPVRRDKSEIVWKRFRSAADTFFARYHDRHKVAAAAQLAEHEALVIALEGLAALEEAPSDLAAQVQTLRTTISNAPHVDGAGAKALHDRWTAALAALIARSPAAFAGSDLDAAAIRDRMERLVAKIESLVKEEAPVVATNKSATELLAERLRSALATNAMGVRPDETRWRAARKAVEEAQETWRRIVRVPGADTGALEERFKAACARVTEQVKLHVSPSSGHDGEFAGGGPGDPSGRSKHPGGRGRGGPRQARGSRDAAREGDAARAPNPPTRRPAGR